MSLALVTRFQKGVELRRRAEALFAKGSAGPFTHFGQGGGQGRRPLLARQNAGTDWLKSSVTSATIKPSAQSTPGAAGIKTRGNSSPFGHGAGMQRGRRRQRRPA